MIQQEAGADMVRREISGAKLSAANLAEVVGKAVDAGKDPRRVVGLLQQAGLVIEPVLDSDALMAGSLRSIPAARSLSLADRLCLALALRSDPAEVLTSDKAWSRLRLPVTVRLIR